MLAMLFSMAGFSAFADGEVKLYGSVRDAYNKQALPNTHIVIRELQLGTITDYKGNFTFSSVPPGTYTIDLSYVGYYDQSFSLSLNDSSTAQHIFMSPKIVEIDPITVSATLNRRNVSKIPGRVSVINAREVDLLPANTTDDLLLGIANVHVNRPWGIFSKGASVSMRGLPGSSRTLLLIDGVPMNKMGGGTVNWNFIEPNDVENIEVVKGPNSALYGNNAMGGVISIKTKRPVKPLEGSVRAFGGSMGTYGGSLSLGGAYFKEDRGFYWNVKGFGRKGDGYIIEPEESRDTTDTNVTLKEYNMGALGGYRFNANNSVELEYRYYNGTFGTGRQVYEEDGAWDQYRSHLLLANYNGLVGKYTLNARMYYQQENFDRQSESLSGSSGKYKLADTHILKHDNGLWMNVSRTFFRDHLFTAGLEFKMGDMDANDIYRTSTDDVTYGGKMNTIGLFLQDEFKLFTKLSVIAGLRFDYASSYDGFLNVENPTSNTGFIEDISADFENSDWTQFSPKLALQYQFNKSIGVYASVATGFMPPKIDDMSKSGKISKGFKLANPQLKPETITNYEVGMTWLLAEKIAIEPSVYYSRGHDFQYFVATGDSVDTGGTDLKPVLQRQNVSDVEIAGFEITASWEFITGLVFTANYAMNSSSIINFSDPTNPDKDLNGKSLIEVPVMESYASLSWRNKIVNVMLDWRYTGKEWYDDENTQYVEPYNLIGIKLSKMLKQGIGFTLSVQNVLDKITVDRKGTLNPGRFIMGEVFYKF